MASKTWSIAIVAMGLMACGGDEPAPADGGGGPSSSSAGGMGGASPAASALEVRWSRHEGMPSTLTQRWGHLAVAVDDHHAVVMGGTREGSESVILADAWWVDTAADPPEMTAITTTVGPDPRYCGCAAWDPERERVVVVGGRDLQGPMAPATWELDPVSGQWTEVAVPSSPPGVIGCAIARAGDGQLYLFGGGGDTGFDDRTYRYDPAAPAWVDLEVTGPAARYDAVMRSQSDGSLVLFAGSMGNTFYADVWRFDPALATWSELAMTGPPPDGRRAPWVTAVADGFYVGFGLQGAQPLEDLWYADLVALTWTQVVVEPQPSARAFSPALPGGRGWMIGGFDGFGPVDETWQLSPER